MSAIAYDKAVAAWKKGIDASGPENFFRIDKATFAKASLQGLNIRRKQGATHDFVYGLVVYPGFGDPKEIFERFITLAGTPARPDGWFKTLSGWTEENSTPENIALLSTPEVNANTAAKVVSGGVASPLTTTTSKPIIVSGTAPVSGSTVGSPSKATLFSGLSAKRRTEIEANITSWNKNKVALATGWLNVITRRANAANSKKSDKILFTGMDKDRNVIRLGYTTEFVNKPDTTKEVLEETNDNIRIIMEYLGGTLTDSAGTELSMASPKSVMASPTSDRIVTGMVGNKTIYGNMANEMKESTTPAPQDGMKRVYIDPVVPVFNPHKREQPLKPLPFAPHQQIITSFTLKPPS